MATIEDEEQRLTGMGVAVVEEPEAVWEDAWDEDEEGEEEEDPSFRWERVRDAAGEEVIIEKRLTGANFLDPKEGDFFVQGIGHDADRAQLTDMLRQVYEDEPRTVVLSDVKIVMRIKGVHEPAPDAMVIPRVTKLDQRRSSFDVREYRVKPIFVAEIVSPRYRKEDRVDKVISYARMGIPEYFLIDNNLPRWRKRPRQPGQTGQRRQPQPRYEVIGYRLVDGVYEQITPDERGWVYSEQTQCWFGVTEDQRSFFVVNGRTGERLQPNQERIKAERAAREEAEQRAEAEAQAREQAERRMVAEAQAREQAERRVVAEAQAREQAEQRAEAERVAREAEAEARKALEAQVAALQAALAQRDASQPPASSLTEPPNQP